MNFAISIFIKCFPSTIGKVLKKNFEQFWENSSFTLSWVWQDVPIKMGLIHFEKGLKIVGMINWFINKV